MKAVGKWSVFDLGIARVEDWKISLNRGDCLISPGSFSVPYKYICYIDGLSALIALMLCDYTLRGHGRFLTSVADKHKISPCVILQFNNYFVGGDCLICRISSFV